MKYKDAGVDVDRANALVDKLRGIFGDVIGPFAGTVEFKGSTLVASTDGIGSKLDLEIKYSRMETAAKDLVAMNVNDIVCMGAKPLFFLDYIACHEIDSDLLDVFFKSLSKTLQEIDCKLLGGETAEMPTVYASGKMDMAGFVCGVVNTADGKKLSKENVKEGDVAIALPSSGPHSNGYTLINRLFEAEALEKNRENVEAVLEPTVIYDFDFPEGIHACAHITGGGIVENLKRVIPKGLTLEFDLGCVPPIFKKIQKAAKISDEEMLRTFNMGTGFVILAEFGKADEVIKTARKYNPRIAGRVIKGEKGCRVRIR